MADTADNQRPALAEHTSALRIAIRRTAGPHRGAARGSCRDRARRACRGGRRRLPLRLRLPDRAGLCGRHVRGEGLTYTRPRTRCLRSAGSARPQRRAASPSACRTAMPGCPPRRLRAPAPAARPPGRCRSLSRSDQPERPAHVCREHRLRDVVPTFRRVAAIPRIRRLAGPTRRVRRRRRRLETVRLRRGGRAGRPPRSRSRRGMQKSTT